MMKTLASLAPQRAVLAVGGDERLTFLHGLLSCATKTLAAGQGTWGALLTAQGKFLHEVFITASEDTLFLDGEADRLEDLFTRLKRFKLRSKVTLELRPDLAVVLAWGASLAALPAEDGTCQAVGGGWALKDPRLPAAGWRLLLPADSVAATLADLGIEAAEFALWDAHRIALGLPDGSRDMTIEGATLLENGFAELKGVDFKKGCFVGQEVTARMRYRGLTKKRLLPVVITGPIPPSGTILRTAEGADAGEMRSACANGAGQGLALVRLSALGAGPLTAEGAELVVQVPEWVVLPPVEKAAEA